MHGGLFGETPSTLCLWNSIHYWNQDDSWRPWKRLRKTTDLIIWSNSKRFDPFQFVIKKMPKSRFFKCFSFLFHGNSWTQLFALLDWRPEIDAVPRRLHHEFILRVRWSCHVKKSTLFGRENLHLVAAIGGTAFHSFLIPVMGYAAGAAVASV